MSKSRLRVYAVFPLSVPRRPPRGSTVGFASIGVDRRTPPWPLVIEVQPSPDISIDEIECLFRVDGPCDVTAEIETAS